MLFIVLAVISLALFLSEEEILGIIHSYAGNRTP